MQHSETENIDDIAFLKELRGRVRDGFDRRDVGQIEFALKMIDDWIDELTPNVEVRGDASRRLA